MLSPAVAAAFEELVREQGASPPEDDNGTSHVRFEGSSATAASIIRTIPGDWTEDAFHETELIDGTGQGVDIELTSALWVHEKERAILVCVDHWQAGLHGRLTVYPDDASFVAARAVQLAESEAHPTAC